MYVWGWEQPRTRTGSFWPIKTPRHSWRNACDRVGPRLTTFSMTQYVVGVSNRHSSSEASPGFPHSALIAFPGHTSLLVAHGPGVAGHPLCPPPAFGRPGILADFAQPPEPASEHGRQPREGGGHVAIGGAFVHFDPPPCARALTPLRSRPRFEGIPPEYSSRWPTLPGSRSASDFHGINYDKAHGVPPRPNQGKPRPA